MTLKRHRQWGGLHSMGAVRLFPLPSFCVLTDRADGTLWVLEHDSGLTHVVVSDDTVDATDKIVYGPYSGPVVGTARLLVRGGKLGYEPLGGAVPHTARVFTRVGDTRAFLEIVTPAGWLAPAALAFEEFDY